MAPRLDLEGLTPHDASYTAQMDDAPKPGPHPWSWIRWVLIGVVVVLWVPSLFDPALAWMGTGFAGILALAGGLTLLLAPAWFLDFRRRYLETGPRWQRRVAQEFQSAVGEPGTRRVRIIGGGAVLVGIALLRQAWVVLANG